MIKFILSLFNKPPPPPLPPKDPNDWSLTTSSSRWYTDTACPRCEHSFGHHEWMSNICNSCGHYGGLRNAPIRRWRKIWNGEKWMIQVMDNYSNEKYSLKEMSEMEKFSTCVA